ncbi:MAG: J domain-containing protein, partial [Armatimonadota bacterium]
MRDYYEILQVHERAIPEIIEKAYRVLARKYHPDVQPPEKKEAAERMMVELNVAYQTLSDARKRADYDATRRQARTPEEVAEAESADEARLLKCFNHPKRPMAAFCFWCGRPVCDLCINPAEPHPQCQTCKRLAERLAEAEPPPEAWPFAERKMGTLGALVYYGVVIVVIAALYQALLYVLDLAHSTIEQTFIALTILTTLVGLLALRELSWGVVCPACEKVNSRFHFRAGSPWSHFSAPIPRCVQCGRWLG